MQAWTALADFLAAHGSLLILPLAIIEGPIVSVTAGLLAASGLLSWEIALPLLIAGDLIGDLGCYWIGRSGSAHFFRLFPRARPNEAQLHDMHSHATHMLLIGKWTHSLGILVLVGAGMVRVDIGRFLLVNLLATVPKGALLFGLGYFAWDSFQRIEPHLLLASLIFIAVAAAMLLLTWRRREAAR